MLKDTMTIIEQLQLLKKMMSKHQKTYKSPYPIYFCTLLSPEENTVFITIHQYLGYRHEKEYLTTLGLYKAAKELGLEVEFKFSKHGISNAFTKNDNYNEMTIKEYNEWKFEILELAIKNTNI